MEVSIQRPFPFHALPRVWRWIEGFRHKVADDFSPRTLEGFIDLQAAKWASQTTWAIYGDGELAGLVSFERLSPWAGTAHLLLKPELHGKGIAMPALRQAFAEMFSLGVDRLVFYVYAGNVAVGSLIVNLGGKREGCLRQHSLQEGKPVDVWIYGLLKQEFESRTKPAVLEEKRESPVRINQQDNQQQDTDADRPGSGPVQSAS